MSRRISNLPPGHAEKQDVLQLREDVREVLDEVRGIPLLDQSEVTATLSAGSNLVAHHLGRTPRGWVITDISAGITLYRSAWDATHLTLVASAPATAGLLVY